MYFAYTFGQCNLFASVTVPHLGPRHYTLPAAQTGTGFQVAEAACTAS
jgi:hypothetical protein